MAGGDLDVSQVDPGVQHGCDERMSEHMWVRAGGAHFRRHPRVVSSAVLVPAGPCVRYGS